MRPPEKASACAFKHGIKNGADQEKAAFHAQMLHNREA
jgi:hypothetical protein